MFDREALSSRKWVILSLCATTFLFHILKTPLKASLGAYDISRGKTASLNWHNVPWVKK